ncbi:MAG TPA: saccharopine dehydrogenase NADP-binding domain-containing protein [Phycicoccus sp.]|jgi:short subunit dehydrogenase-like uncharacterized protein|nr:saccharopine dehydrogenase NADP-binding domain-containing protein [Phycicoccus sp.]
MTARDHDLVLFGATGFVGQLTAKHLVDNTPAGTRVALAGRNRDKLEKVRADLGAAAADWPVLVLDASDADAVADLARSTTVVVTTVGPYAKYGMPLLAACAEAGTHYCDLTGEVLFVRDAIDEHHARAVETGAKIVPSCGFDSIPSDLGVLVLAEAVREAGAGELGETLNHVRSLRGGVSGGTIDSMRQQTIVSGEDKALRRIAGDPYGLSPDRGEEPPSRNRPTEPPANILEKVARQSPARLDPVTGRWVAPFFMASYNTRIVRRSNALTNWSYGRTFRYDEVMDTGKGVGGAVKAGLTTAVLGGLFGGMSFGPTRSVLDRVLPKPGEGPSEESQAKGRFVMEIVTTTTTGADFRTTVAADYDPGYSGTAIMLGQAALALALDTDRLPTGGGVLTPATALGDVLVDRLREHGFTFETRQAS